MASAQRPPRDDIFRAASTTIELDRGADNPGGMPTMRGHFSVFNQWTTIDSVWEGKFRERVAPGAFQKTMSENRAAMLVLYDHGHDPQMGNKPIGPIIDLREDETGAYYEVRMLDTLYNRELIPSLEERLLGSSFRFRVLQEEWVDKPTRSAENPTGLKERTLTEVEVREFGPVSFPAYAGATAGIARSVTDDVMLLRLAEHPEKLQELCERAGIKLAGVATLPSTAGVTINIADSSLLGVPPRGNTTLSTSSYGLNLINDSTQPLEDEPRAEGEPEPPEATTPPPPTEPEPSAATTRAKARPGGLYPNREEKPPWLL